MSAALGPEGLARLADPALALSGVDGVEVVVQRSAEAVTRFADSRSMATLVQLQISARE